MRNLVIIHLESLNLLNYRMNSRLFPTLYGLEKRGVFFEKYYSTATSTIMVTTDLAYGGIMHDESCRGINWRLEKQTYNSSLFDDLHNDGYRTLVAQYPSGNDDMRWININHRYGLCTNVDFFGSYKEYINEIEEFVRHEGAFALWVCPYTANIAYNSYELDGRIRGLDRWRIGYERLDDQVRDIIRILEKSKLMEKTTLVLYGDHGDDLYQHGMYGGLSHAIEPFETLIHTPLVIIDDRLSPCRTDALLDTTQIGKIIRGLLKHPEKAMALENLAYDNKRFILSRNLYAAQLVKAGSFEKAYSLTDGNFLLVAGIHGLRFYDTVMDPTCALNLLDFYVMSEEKLVIYDHCVSKMKFHFPYIFDRDSLEFIASKFVKMRERLIEEVTEVYVEGECIERIYEIDFDHIYYSNKHAEECGLQEQKNDLFGKYYQGKKVILYGAGDYGTHCFDIMKDQCTLVAWVDRDFDSKNKVLDNRLKSPDVICEFDYEVIFVAIKNLEIKQEVYDWLIAHNIPKEKII